MRITRARAGAGLAALAGAVALVVGWQVAAQPAACAAVRAASGSSGSATFYDLTSGGGNCSYPTPADDLYVALSPPQYAAARGCGAYYDVTGPKGTVRVLASDQCPECAAGHLDLSRTAFTELADPVKGLIPISYRRVVDPPVPPLAFRIKEGSSRYWFAVLVENSGNPVRSVQLKRGSSWISAEQADYNYWLIDSGAGPGPFTIRVTDDQRHVVIASGITLSPGATQRSSVRMYGGSSSGSVSGPVKRPAAVTSSPSSAGSKRPANGAAARPATRVPAAPVTSIRPGPGTESSSVSQSTPAGAGGRDAVARTSC